MKNTLLFLKLGLVSAMFASILACGSAQKQNGGNSANSPNAVKSENINAAQAANSNNSSSPMETANKMTANGIKLPEPNPIEKGKPQKFYSNMVSYTVPANWKRTIYYDDNVRFDSPDKKLTLMMSVSKYKTSGDMMQQFTKSIEEKPEEKASMRALGGDTLGILRFIDFQKEKSNYINWVSYPPPNSEGEAPVLSISVWFPYGEFEQHKQLISDIYGSIVIKK